VELYAEPGEITQMKGVARDGVYLYSAEVPANRPANIYTPRVISYHSGASIPLESAKILWQR
jgi:hypothetical protein